MTQQAVEKIGCESKMYKKASVENGWTELLPTKCGWYFDGKKEFCDKCLSNIL